MAFLLIPIPSFSLPGTLICFFIAYFSLYFCFAIINLFLSFTLGIVWFCCQSPSVIKVA